jgi:hypothetical protein
LQWLPRGVWWQAVHSQLANAKELNMADPARARWLLSDEHWDLVDLFVHSQTPSGTN